MSLAGGVEFAGLLETHGPFAPSLARSVSRV